MNKKSSFTPCIIVKVNQYFSKQLEDKNSIPTCERRKWNDRTNKKYRKDLRTKKTKALAVLSLSSHLRNYCDGLVTVQPNRLACWTCSLFSLSALCSFFFVFCQLQHLFNVSNLPSLLIFLKTHPIFLLTMITKISSTLCTKTK